MTRTQPNDPWPLVDLSIDLRDALPCLTEKQAEVLGLYFDLEHTQQETAEILGMSQQAVSRLIERGLDAIRRAMGL